MAPQPTPEPLADFTPAVRDWFTRSFAAPTDAQASRVGIWAVRGRGSEAAQLGASVLTRAAA